ncbi:MAG: DMT family transporter [Beijerinckiaceae bacterium]|jgi:drug/metabolite transporter (DMT)-like permease|nr:DMT family transporter [Beijerinckiaceae bacterium]
MINKILASERWNALTSNPWLLLGATVVIWGGNTPVIRLAVGEISPMAIVSLRWLIVGAIIMMFLPKSFGEDWKKMRRRPFLLTFMVLVMTASNALVFSAAKYTSGINLSILQGAAPVVVLIGARLFYGMRIGFVRGIGVVLSITGILFLATRGDLSAIFQLSFNIGDIFMLSAVSLYGGYILVLRLRPAISNYSLFCMIAIGSFFFSLPLIGMEYAQGATIWPSFKGFLALLYVAFLTSMLGHIMFMRAVDLLGAGRASQFQNLTPVIGALLSVLFLGEVFAQYHTIALAFVIGGILIAERYAPPG